MSLVESWWHRDLDADVLAPRVEDPDLTVDGATGHLVDAPPVYTPGGPVLLVFQVDSRTALAGIENAAAVAGAVVSVVPETTDEPERRDLLAGAGYKRTTDFFSWRR